MPKKFFEDIKPLTSHDTVPQPVKRSYVRKEKSVFVPVSEEPSLNHVEDKDEELDKFFENPENKKSKKGMFKWAIVFLLTLGAVYGALVIFSTSRVVLSERVETGVLDTSILSSKSKDTSGLRFEIMSVEGSASKTILSETKKDVSIKATGVVMIYNNFSSASQKLVANTRLEATDGKIYRLQKAVTVPGKTGTGASAKPGSVEASILADAGGDAYNKEFSDFKIPGFKGSPRYEGFSAKTKSAITGGKEGSLYVAKIENANTLQAELSVLLRAKLIHDAENQIPEGYYLFTDGIVLSEDTTTIPDEVSGETENVPVSLSGKLDAVLLPKEDLEKFIASKTLSQYDEASISVENLDTLSFSFNQKYTDLKEVSEISFTLKGSPVIVWDIDQEEIKSALLGKSKKEFNGIMAGFKGVSSAELHLRPFFLTKIPADPNKTEILITRESI